MSRRSALSAEVISELLRRGDGARRSFSKRLAGSGVTLQQYNVLRILRGGGPEGLPTLTIAERMMEKTPGITRLLDRLEAKGLVGRERSSEDRRLVRISITKRGRKLLESLDATMNHADEQVVRGLNRRERRRLLALLEKLS